MTTPGPEAPGPGLLEDESAFVRTTSGVFMPNRIYRVCGDDVRNMSTTHQQVQPDDLPERHHIKPTELIVIFALYSTIMRDILQM